MKQMILKSLNLPTKEFLNATSRYVKWKARKGVTIVQNYYIPALQQALETLNDRYTFLHSAWFRRLFGTRDDMT